MSHRLLLLLLTLVLDTINFTRGGLKGTQEVNGVVSISQDTPSYCRSVRWSFESRVHCIRLRGGSGRDLPYSHQSFSAGAGSVVRSMARVGEDESEWDVWAYNDAIKKSATFEQCLSLLRRLEVADDGLVTPNTVTYHGILECALRGSAEDAHQACHIFERIPRAQRNHHTYACAIRLYAKLGTGGHTARLLAEGKEHNIAPDADMISASMEAQVARTPQTPAKHVPTNLPYRQIELHDEK